MVLRTSCEFQQRCMQTACHVSWDVARELLQHDGNANFCKLRKLRKFKRTFLGLAMPAENLSIDLTISFPKFPEFWYGSPAQDTQVLN